MLILMPNCCEFSIFFLYFSYLLLKRQWQLKTSLNRIYYYDDDDNDEYTVRIKCFVVIDLRAKYFTHDTMPLTIWKLNIMYNTHTAFVQICIMLYDTQHITWLNYYTSLRPNHIGAILWNLWIGNVGTAILKVFHGNGCNVFFPVTESKYAGY